MAYMKTGQGFEKKKSKPHELWPFLVLTSVGSLCVFGFCFLGEKALRICLYDSLLAALALFSVWIYWIRAYRQDRFSYDNGEHPCRFWACMGTGVLLDLAMCFFPAGVWPVSAVFLLLTLFGNVSLGIVGGTALLAIPCLLREISIDRFLLQFLAGVFTAAAFQRYNGEESLAKPAARSFLGAAFCMSLGVLCHGPGDEKLWLQVLQNLLLTAALYCGILIFFSGQVLYRNKKIYERLLDPEGELLAGYRKNAKLDYLRSVHTVYFCEKIAGRLGWPADVMKCAAYYYRWGSELPALIKKEKFPARSARILLDYFDSEMADIPQVRYRETAAVVCADVVLGSMIYLVNSGAALPRYDVIIEAIFERMRRKGTFDKCEISGRELCVIKKLFKEETYYYDSLRRK